jgi:hypothetical protein
LYDAINRQETEYQKIVQNINSLVPCYISEIESLVMDNQCVVVHGLLYDKDGIVDGFDYSDIAVVSLKNTACSVRTIDEITEETVRATLLCTADIDAECSYEDYDNAAWDHETELYYFLETRKNLEKHSARFGIRIEVNRKTDSLRIIPFKVILNGDTLRDWSEIDEDDSEMDLINQDRENIGFCSLDRYSDYLEDNLSESPFMTSVISIFEKINSSYQEYEEVDEVILWADQSYDRLSVFSEQANLSDNFKYGETIEIRYNDEIYKFVVDELLGIPFVGDEELIDLPIKDKVGNVIAKGYAKLIVGYLDFDEDGGAGDGIEDDIEYCCEDVVNALENIAKSISECIKKEWAVAKKIETVI